MQLKGVDSRCQDFKKFIVTCTVKTQWFRPDNASLTLLVSLAQHKNNLDLMRKLQNNELES